VQLEPAVPEPPSKHGRQHSAPGFVPSALVPPDDLLRQAAAVINAGRKVAMLVGAGALPAASEVERVAERVGAGVAKSLLGKAVVPDDLSYVSAGQRQAVRDRRGCGCLGPDAAAGTGAGDGGQADEGPGRGPGC